MRRWLQSRDESADDLRVLAQTNEQTLRGITNAGKIAGRTKAQVVIDAAGAQKGLDQRPQAFLHAPSKAPRTHVHVPTL